eukprot:TRINITY_DN5607_c1_g1_i1.p2 TRINITY_DN5607_c1_g1~~TRINITY_DN5607_c1_g1_i1.p2  ORF type:complete len:295 (+),score=65.92 TRINITY_DN5607_c1_g1_i1:81-965(+)
MAQQHQQQQQQQQHPPPNVVTSQKVSAFRDFATSLVAQVVEQVTGEYEREVTMLYTDLVNYRTELARVTELLGQQLGRERQLHEMLETMSNHHTTITSQAQQVAQQQPNSKEIHELVDRMVGQQASIINTTLQGMSQAHSVAQNHAAQAKLLQEPMLDAENEFSRVMHMLQGPASAMTSMNASGCGASCGGGSCGGTMPAPSVTHAHQPRTFPAPHVQQQQAARSTPPVSPCMGGQVAYRQIPPGGVSPRTQVHVMHGGHQPPAYMSPGPPQATTIVQTPPHPGTFLGGGPTFA